MELKDVILSTLAEMEDNEITKKVLNSSIQPKKMEKSEISDLKPDLQCKLLYLKKTGLKKKNLPLA